MPPSREAFHIGPFQIGDFRIDVPVYWYGIMIMLGVIVASWLSYREAKRRGEDPEHVWQMFPWVLIAGVVGARLGFILPNLGDPRYLEIGNIVSIWTGGLSIQGAVIGGALAIIIYCNRNRISFFKWGDIIVPGLALAQAIGRWGNFFNQEAFGQPTTLPWGIPISRERQQEVAGIDQSSAWTADTRFHPTFAYEMIWDLLNFGLLMWLGRQKRFKLLEGDLIWVYLVVYSVGRFFIEAIRVDSAKVAGIAAPQAVALLTIIVAWGFFLYRHRPGTRVPVSLVNVPDAERERYTRGARTRARRAEGESRIRRVPTTVLTSKAPEAEAAARSSAPASPETLESSQSGA